MIVSGKPRIDLIHGDCMDYMATLPDNAFELAIVDPPYGIDWMSHVVNENKGKNWKKYERKEWDLQIPNESYYKTLFRVSRNQIIWGGNYMIGHLYPSPCWLIWDKMQEFDGAVFEMAWTSFATPAKAFRMSRVQAYTNQCKIHPTQKPVALYRWLLHNYAKQGDRILDTHLGSGSSAIACHGMGFDMVGIELDADYYTASVKRFKEQTAQVAMAL
jgi:site-specific DNA-methyltransferase (adenine-specific)